MTRMPRSLPHPPLRPAAAATSLNTAVFQHTPEMKKMKFKLTDKRKLNYLVLSLLAIIIIVGVIQALIDTKILPVH